MKRGLGRGFSFAAGSAASSVAEATTAAISIIWCRRPLHVRLPVHKKLIGRPSPVNASPSHTFLRLYPNRFPVLRQVVAAGADTRVSGVGGLVYH